MEPGQYARMTTIGSSLEDMQKVVGGYIQEAPFFRDPVTLVCNEEGKISGLPLNRAIRDDDGKIIDVVAGTFFICGAEGDHFSSIPKELQKKYEEKFKKPEAFLKMGRSIMRFPRSPRRQIRSRTGKHRAWSCNRRPESMQRKEMMHLAGGG